MPQIKIAGVVHSKHTRSIPHITGYNEGLRESLVMSGFQYFSQLSLRSSGATLRSLPLCPALGGMKPKRDTTKVLQLLHN